MSKLINLLIIEDNPDDIKIIYEILKKSGEFNINFAETLKKAISYLAENDVDVIFLDLNLPDEIGIRSFVRINNIAKNIPIIIMSGITDKETIYQVMQKGAQAYLIKGEVEKDALFRIIHYAIWSRSSNKL